MNWKPIQQMPQDGKFYLTKIDDHNGERNVQKLKREKNLFWDNSGMYVYYTPTHYAP